jgi:hypothetical protein
MVQQSSEFRRDRQDDGYSSGFSEALMERLAQMEIGERFFEAGSKAAVQAGCEFLFEIPPVLLEKNADRAAASRCGRDGTAELYFLVFEARRGAVTILAEDEVPEMVLEFTLSYAGVLGMIAKDGNLTRSPVH